MSAGLQEAATATANPGIVGVRVSLQPDGTVRAELTDQIVAVPTVAATPAEPDEAPTPAPTMDEEAELARIQEQLNELQRQDVELVRQREALRSQIAEAANRRRTIEVLKAQKARWRVYQVWRTIDDQGVCDWTPNRGSSRLREDHKIKEVGQIIHFDLETRLKMCRSGTHNARFAADAINDNPGGKRLARLELEGYIESGGFNCMQAKVLLILDIEATKKEIIASYQIPVFTEDDLAGTLRRLLDDTDPYGLEQQTRGELSSRESGFKNRTKSILRLMLSELEAGREISPELIELLVFVGERYTYKGNSFTGHLMGISYNNQSSDETLLSYLRVMPQNMNRMRRKKAAATDIFNGQSYQETEKVLREYLAKKYPDVKIKDFGVKRGQNSLDPSAEVSPTYWFLNS